MVHNGIEYGDMQLICEAYQLLKDVLGYSNEQLNAVFTEWNKGDLDSYLIEITAQIFARKDDENPQAYVVDQILDSAGQKGTGKWTATSALDFGMPVTLIGEAVFARCLSALKDERVLASKELPGPCGLAPFSEQDREKFISGVRDALYASKLVSYAQGFTLLRAAAADFGWNLNYGGIALMWRGGCIIRSKFLGKITEAFKTNPKLSNLLLDPFFKNKVSDAQAGWRYACGVAIARGIPTPAMSTALCYYDGFRTARLPANLLQAQRDFFGAHTYERLDKARGQFFHTNWTGVGGSTSSTSYNV
jgi:6-phosphogluconate dehydrogenase